MSRIVDGRFVLGDEENAFLRETIWALRGFTGVRVLTYCLMSNHIHVLLCVPDESEFAGEEISDEMLVGMVRPLYGKEAAKRLEMELGNCDEQRFAEKEARNREGYMSRRGRLDSFMKR